MKFTRQFEEAIDSRRPFRERAEIILREHFENPQYPDDLEEQIREAGYFITTEGHRKDLTKSMASGYLSEKHKLLQFLQKESSFTGIRITKGKTGFSTKHPQLLEEVMEMILQILHREQLDGPEALNDWIERNKPREALYWDITSSTGEPKPVRKIQDQVKEAYNELYHYLLRNFAPIDDTRIYYGLAMFKLLTAAGHWLRVAGEIVDPWALGVQEQIKTFIRDNIDRYRPTQKN